MVSLPRLPRDIARTQQAKRSPRLCTDPRIPGRANACCGSGHLRIAPLALVYHRATRLHQRALLALSGQRLSRTGTRLGLQDPMAQSLLPPHLILPGLAQPPSLLGQPYRTPQIHPARARRSGSRTPAKNRPQRTVETGHCQPQISLHTAQRENSELHRPYQQEKSLDRNALSRKRSRAVSRLHQMGARLAHRPPLNRGYISGVWILGCPAGHHISQNVRIVVAIPLQRRTAMLGCKTKYRIFASAAARSTSIPCSNFSTGI